ncbi:MAG: hypothetical protein JO307_24845 [Bryobacterales bacterium]|nr:hypothetical protein [Bryobacterales bacterium]MBV9399692.1 hypothetical protein [Bryobacterales bacterium]
MARESRCKRLFILPLTTAISGAMLSCSSDLVRETQASADTKVCVDDSGRRVPNADCDNPNGSHHHWYYINGGGYVPHPRFPVRGGSYEPASTSRSYSSAPETSPANPVTRGGFGQSAEAHGASGDGAGE